METKYTTCVFCDGGCRVKAEVDGDRLRVLPADPAFPAICPKAGMVDAYRLHPDRVTVPLKNVGERGEPQWQEMSWDQALDEIAALTARRPWRSPRCRSTWASAASPAA